jgi:hypothetical protein
MALDGLAIVVTEQSLQLTSLQGPPCSAPCLRMVRIQKLSLRFPPQPRPLERLSEPAQQT